MSDETKSELPATTEDEENTILDVVTDLTLDSTIPAPIRRNALKAFDRLCSALIDVPVGALERRSAEKRSESEARIRIREEITAQIVQQVKVDPEYALKAGHKFAEKIIREQLNLDKISAIAANELKNSESNNPTDPDTSEPNKEQSTDSTNQDINSGEEKTIDDYWLNIFATEARPVSTEEMQHRFGRVLAGEIEKPESYSIKAVKLLGELDQKTAALFKRLCSACVVFGFFRIPNSEHIIDAGVLSLGGSAGSNALSKYGLGFGQLNLLNEYDLIISNYNSWFKCNLYLLGGGKRAFLPFEHQGKYWNLLPLSEQENDLELKLSGVVLSRVGRELFRIVDQDPMPEYTEDLRKFFAEQNLNMIEVNIP